MRNASIMRISVTEILNSSFSVYLSSLEIFFSIFLALNVVNVALIKFILGFLPPFNPPYISADSFLLRTVNYLASSTPILSLAFLSAWILTNLGCGLAVKSAFDIFEGRKVNVKSNLILVFKLLKDILSVSFLTGVLIVSGIILFIFPGIIMAVIFNLSIPALISERLGVFRSLKRSRDLTDGAWWKTFLLLTAVFILLAAAYLSAELLTTVLRSSIAKTMATIIAISLVEPIYPISISNLYNVLERQKAAHRPIDRETAYQQRIFESEVKVCYNCGQILPYDAVYCPNCGVRAV